MVLFLAAALGVAAFLGLGDAALVADFFVLVAMYQNQFSARSTGHLSNDCIIYFFLPETVV